MYLEQNVTHVPGSDPDLFQQIGPVVHAAAYQRQLLSAGIGNVDADIEQVLTGPPQHNLISQFGISHLEMDSTGNGYRKLYDRASGRAYKVAKEHENDVASLMEGKIYMVYQYECRFVTQVWQTDGNQYDRQYYSTERYF